MSIIDRGWVWTSAVVDSLAGGDRRSAHGNTAEPEHSGRRQGEDPGQPSAATSTI